MKIIKLLGAALVLVMSFAPACFAGPGDAGATESGKDKDRMELTIEDAVNRALRFSESVEMAGLEVDKADDATVHASTYHYVTPGFENLVFLSESSHFNYEKAKKEYQKARDNVALKAFNNYYQVLRKQKELEAAKAALEVAEKELSVTRALYSVGMTTGMGLDGAETKVASSEAAVKKAEKELENAYASLNQLVALDEDERPELVDEPEFKEIKYEKSTYVSRVLRNSPDLWTAEEYAELADSLKNMGAGNQEITSEDAEKAELQADSARDATRLGARTLYNTVKTMEDQYETAKQNVKLKEQSLKITEVKYELGMATKADLVQSQADLTEAQKNLFNLKCQHTYLKKALQMPWAYNPQSQSQ